MKRNLDNSVLFEACLQASPTFADFERGGGQRRGRPARSIMFSE